jgi:hypothetical protein
LPGVPDLRTIILSSPKQYRKLEVNDLVRIEFDRLLGCSVDELIALVQRMPADHCEECARGLLSRIGGPSFEQLMMRLLETANPKDGVGPAINADAYYGAVRELFPHITQESDVLGRLLLLAMQVATLRLEEHPNLSTH